MSATVELVRRWDVPACEAGVRRLFGIADDLEDAYERLHGIESRLAGWRGPAAAQALPRVRRAVLAVSTLAGTVRQVAQAVCSGLAGFAGAVRLARAVTQSPAELTEAAVTARSVDRRVATALAAVAPARGVAMPNPAWTPAEVAAWWTTLPPDRRRLALSRRPALLGALAGLPAAVRDAANRLQLSRLLPSLRAERDRMRAAGFPAVPPELRWVGERVGSQLAIAETVARVLAAHEHREPVARLLTLDLEGAGRVAIGLGDVDRARHVAVVVPGMGQDARHGVERTVAAADRLLRQAEGESTAGTAVLAWVGYAAPGWAQVPFPTRALAGGRGLAADLRALAAGRTVDGGDPPHLTVIGHSYGSTVVGAAATTQPLIADDLVLLGSPGAMAEHTDQLSRPRGHVFVGEARFDLVADLGAFGADPGDPRFGATRIRADPGPEVPWPERVSGGDHSHYFDTDSESLRNVARVVVGRGAEVTLMDSEGER
ncbi:MAG TPA: alpha/beta hydrolase [Mycobacteriales bacterium]|nr:alpha/beta hydrolase [Mycobacteriales bacterium]